MHADGEIWAETLWDLRTRLIADLGAVDGVQAAERLVTGGMRLSPPEPSFLDMRNAILLADEAAGGTLRSAIWAVFAQRGMGYFASTTGADDAEPREDFAPPPGSGRAARHDHGARDGRHHRRAADRRDRQARLAHGDGGPRRASTRSRASRRTTTRAS